MSVTDRTDRHSYLVSLFVDKVYHNKEHRIARTSCIGLIPT